MSEYPGMGVMIHMLFGDNSESVRAIETSKGKIITHIELDHSDPDRLRIIFEDGTKLAIWDDGQSCCETRYMDTDDDLSQFIGASFIEAHIKDAPNIEHDYEVHEVQFLRIETSLGDFTIQTHNEHNGYYGGFWLIAEIEED